ncbi:pyridoxal 5'-phosphate synthase [Jejudonia soesokkakensis]|uniref:Pyridoxal 5'-phosphate synthase n=1 Tax=Jejudonia soesokkakensis TaxID=1323432 RepID=A0ABW2MY10_9FLAO
MKQPLLLFSEWYKEELTISRVEIPSAVCLSTMGVDQFPNARFVSFKEIKDSSFVITGPLQSRKGLEIEYHNKVALTFWWTETARQVRIQGVATKLSDEFAEEYFKQRSLMSQAVSSLSKQGKEADSLEELEKKIQKKISENTKIKRPEDWSGFSIKPTRMEFMEFKKSRFHNRKLYELDNNKWHLKQLQP